MESKIDLRIPEGEIKNAIAIAIAESFTQEKKDALIRDVIRGHLSQRKDSYSRSTLLDECVGSLIRKIAEEELVVVLETMRPQIKNSISKYLGVSFKDSLCSQVEEALKHTIIYGLKISVEALPKNEDL